MNYQKAFLLLNGVQPKKIPNLDDYGLVCGTDGAYKTFKVHNITPDFISGDFDSLKELPQNIEVIDTPNQNYTDFDKILQIILDKGFTTVDVYGASGKEQDHFLGNLHTAMQWKEKLQLTFFDDFGYYFLLEKEIEIKNSREKTVSLIPFPNANSITTEGLMYSLENEDLVFGERIGTRNVANSDTVKITYESGNLFIFINDKEL